MDQKNAECWIEKYNMKPHPEGGYFVETYRSKHMIPHEFKKNEIRHCSTGIIFLMKKYDFSAFHKIDMDEMWHFYHGKDLEVVEIDPETKTISKQIIGVHHPNAVVQYTVPKGHWFASRPLQSDCKESDDFCVVGCTCSPGFEFADFVMPKRETLLKEYPQFETDILSLTRQM